MRCAVCRFVICFCVIFFHTCVSSKCTFAKSDTSLCLWVSATTSRYCSINCSTKLSVIPWRRFKPINNIFNTKSFAQVRNEILFCARRGSAWLFATRSAALVGYGFLHFTSPTWKTKTKNKNRKQRATYKLMHPRCLPLVCLRPHQLSPVKQTHDLRKALRTRSSECN